MNIANLQSLRDATDAILKNEVKHLPLVSSVALKLLELTNDDLANFADLTHIIETEPTLAAKTLRHVNSAAYGLNHKVTSVHRAVNLLGFSAVRQLAIDLLFYDKLIKRTVSKAFDPLFFWQHCLFVAILSKKIAQCVQHPNPDLVYTAGLIHDIGKVVLESFGKVSYSDFLQTLNNTNSAQLENERRFFGISHAELGYVFCLEWQIPEAIAAVVACHHAKEHDLNAFSAYHLEIAIIAFANYVAWMQGIGSVHDEGHAQLEEHVLATLPLAQLDLDAILQAVDQEMQKTREFYGIHFPSVTKLRATLVRTTLNLSQLRLPEASANQPSTSLTLPHQSLNPDEFVPNTLAAIQAEFRLDRCLLLDIDAKRRCLSTLYICPANCITSQSFALDPEHIAGKFLHCLRDKSAEIINSVADPNNPFTKQLGAQEFLIVPVSCHNRLIAMLYADNVNSSRPLAPTLPKLILPIVYELGIALQHAREYAVQKKCAQIDPLTQLFNKRMIEECLTQIFQQDPVKITQLAVGFIDIDHFKSFNDVCGHQAGDDVLKIVADIFRSLTRPTDFIGRYGGEEFLFVLKNTDIHGAYAYAERLRAAIERRGKLMSKRFHGHALTVSIGVALYTPEYMNYPELVHAADQAMYKAKSSGRNKVIMLANRHS